MSNNVLSFDNINGFHGDDSRYPFCVSSLGLLNNHESGFEHLNPRRKIDEVEDITMFEDRVYENLSTEDVMRVAGEMFIQSSSQCTDSLSVLDHRFRFNHSTDVELALILLAAAEKVAYQQYEGAARLVTQCEFVSSKKGNPVQRVVYYFSEALRERIERETGTISISSKGSMIKPVFNFDESMMTPNPTTLACHEDMPFSQIIQFAGIQAIVENVARSKRIHVIDFGIKTGMQWTVLMQALSSRYECPIELLKVTAVATNGQRLIEETGKHLSSFARSLGLPFSFKIVMVSDMLDLKEDLFELDDEETIAVYAATTFRTLLAMPDRLEHIMKVIRLINPCLMVVSEVEANHNSPIFVERFIEALFFFSAYFDCLATCMKGNCGNREIIESMYFGEGIRNIVASEGEERKVRNVKFDVWRSFFVRFGMEEAELSMSSLYQAYLVLKNFACGGFCTLELNGKCLLVGWKGTRMHSISVWKFL